MRPHIPITAWIPIAALAGIAANAPQSLAQTASATYNGVTYQVTSREDSYPKNNQEAPWLGDQAMAEALAKAFTTQLGTGSGRRKAFPSSGTNNGPSFIYEIVPSGNASLADAKGWEWSTLYNQAVQEGHSVNPFTGRTRSSASVYGATIEFAILVNSFPTASSITLSGNTTSGNGNNLSSNLGGTLLPQFEGGTLTIDQQGATFQQDFTLDNSTTNAIDANGNNAAFNGVISNAANALQGGIGLINSASGTNNTITLTNINSFTGPTTIGERVVLALRDGGSISESSAIEIKRGGRLNIDYRANSAFADKETRLQNISGLGDLQPNTPIEVAITQDSTFDGRIQGIANIRKTGGSTWTLTSNQNSLRGSRVMETFQSKVEK
jgi:hypothetical protein